MCRVLFLAVNPRVVGIQSLLGLVNAFIEASKRDPYLEKVSRGSRSSHSDGWGIAVGAIYREHPVFFYEKSILPVYHELSKQLIEYFIYKLSEFEKTYIVLHSRAASRGEPLGSQYSHPYREDYSFGVLYLAHNGGVDKKALSRDLGLYPWIYTDSQLLTKYIARELSRCLKSCEDLDSCVADIYRSVYERYLHSCSALVTGLLISCRDDIYLYASTVLRERDVCREDLKVYYDVYRASGSHIIAVLSSTVSLYIPRGLELSLELFNQVLAKVDVHDIEILYRFT